MLTLKESFLCESQLESHDCDYFLVLDTWQVSVSWGFIDERDGKEARVQEASLLLSQ